MIERRYHLLEQVWQKAGQIPGMDPENYRRDEQGSIIRKEEFNNESSIYGWCLNYLKPFWEGGNTELSNVTPLSCRNKLISLAIRLDYNENRMEYWD